MTEIWTEKDEAALREMQERKQRTFLAAKAELLAALKEVVPKQNGSTYSGYYAPVDVADALIQHGGMFRDALLPFDHMGRES